MYLGRARERGSRAAPPAISSGVLSPCTSNLFSSAVSCKSLEAETAKSLSCLMANWLGRAGEPMWSWKKRDNAGDGGREGREKGEKGIKAQRSFFPPHLAGDGGREGKEKGEKGIKARRSFFPPPLCVLLAVVEAG